MLCSQCNKNNANVHIVHQINGVHKEIFLCEQCSRNNPSFNVTVPSGTNDMHLNINGILQGFIGGHSPSLIQRKVFQCQVCGMDFNEFQKNGKLGCENCYDVFINELAPVIARIHGNVDYKGKSPGTSFANKKQDNQLEALKRELKEAIAREEYERAAQLRDAIRDFENGEKQV